MSGTLALPKHAEGATDVVLEAQTMDVEVSETARQNDFEQLNKKH